MQAFHNSNANVVLLLEQGFAVDDAKEGSGKRLEPLEQHGIVQAQSNEAANKIHVRFKQKCMQIYGTASAHAMQSN